ncbi:hypothetical protein [Herbaspirillum sp. ST 5-3]|uniref:hypothetical protein n=1 Tax=Oxalobacteraceae TaxID=75682 RepID=UPI0010A4974B|nr:hypothetical protein [Herbaspirillum sp. ST 5-3]
MDKTDARRKQIADIIAALPDTDGTGVVEHLFEPLRIELTSLISEEGFRSVFERSVFLAGRKFAWLSVEQPLSGALPLDDLKTKLAQQESAEARQASTVLLLNISDLMASLIGELLTIDILRSAWGKDALGSLDEEFQP